MTFELHKVTKQEDIDKLILGQLKATHNGQFIVNLPEPLIKWENQALAWTMAAEEPPTLQWIVEGENDVPPLKKKEDSNIASLLPFSKLYKYPPLSKYEGLTGKIPVRAGTTFVGVEFELERVDYKQIPEKVWRVDEDHSLKDKGLEFISKPIQLKYLEVEILRLFQGISSYNISSRCSTHVHLNVRDFTSEEVIKLMLLYMVFERSLYRFSGDRWNNNFCVPLCFYPNQIRKVYIESKNGYLPEHWYKYFGFNLSPVFGGESGKIGTIEFRHMGGYRDVESLITWINLIVSLKITAKAMPLSDILTHIETMNTTSGYYWLANETFKDFSSFIIHQKTFKQDVESCISIVKGAVFPANTTNKLVTLYPERG